MEIGERIRALRKERSITQVKLAQMTGISQSSISDIEKLTNNPSSTTLKLIASALGVTVSELLGETAPDPNEVKDEVWQLREQLRRDPNTRILFDAAKDAKPEHIKAAAAMLRSLKGEG